MAEMKSLNGNTFVDQSARNEIEALKKNGVGGGGGDVTTGAMQAAIAAAIQEHNEQIQVHQNRLNPLAEELIAIKQTVSGIPKFKIEVVTVHPTITEASTTTVYLVPSGGADGNLYTEWICVEDDSGARTWEKLGTQNLDLTGYVTDEELSAAVAQALLIAKESGEFKGETGETGPRGPQGPAYTLTETDKALIVAQVIESLGGNPIFGYVDEENNIIVQGNLGDGTYSVKYEMEDGSTVDIGNLVLDTNVYYSITKNLTNCVLDNSATKVVAGGSYSATVTANSGYTLDSVSVTMGGSAVSVSGGVINIASVTGDIVITAVASEATVTPSYTNLFDPSTALINKRVSNSYELKDGVGHVTTVFIDIQGKVPFTDSTKLYVKGATFNKTASGQSQARICTYKTLPTNQYEGAYSVLTAETLTQNDEGNGVISVSGVATSFHSDIKYMVLTLKVSDSTITTDDIKNIVVTIDEPIV